MVADHGGRVPHEDAALRALPGVGPYTARAVRTFAFGDDVAAVDTNGVRVLARAVAGARLSVREATTMGDRLVPAGKSWEFNQAMFDLGATVCTAARPDCARCPLSPPVRLAPSGAATDPWRSSPTARPQSTFEGSDRQGRGRLLHALRQGAVRQSALAGGLRLARGPGPGRAGGGRRGGRGIRPMVGPQGSRPPAARGPEPGRLGGQEVHDATVDDVRSLDVQEVAGVIDDLDREPSAMKSSGEPMDDRACTRRRARAGTASG